MELLRDLEKACNIVAQGRTLEQRNNAVQVLYWGTVDVDAAGAKELFQRRALLMTMLREKKIWGHPTKKNPPPDEEPPDEEPDMALV